MSLAQNLPLPLMQTSWASELNPLLKNPLLNGLQLSNIKLAATTPLSINHLLQRQMQGWILVDNSASTTVWRTQPLNTLTLTLEASAATTISIWVF